jgi:proline iminopeptidase
MSNVRRRITARLLVVVACTVAVAPAVAQPSGAAPAHEGFVHIPDGTRLWYRDGGGEGPVLVVPLAAHLSEDLAPLTRGRRVVFYDVRGRGRSDLLRDSSLIGMRQDVEDLEVVRRGLGLERMQLLGYSYLGAMTALYAMEHPERVERIVQVGPIAPRRPAPYGGEPPRGDPWRPDTAGYAALRRRVEAGEFASDPGALCRAYYRLSMPRLFGTAEGAARHRTEVDLCTLPTEQPEHLAEHFRHHMASLGERFDHRPAAARLRVPVLTIHGTFDRNAPYEGGREWAESLANARLLTVEGAAHQVFSDRPDIFFPAVETFLRGEWPVDAVRVR